MCHYKIIEIRNLEPLKIGARGSQSIYREPAKDYIPGSTIRGAIIKEMIRRRLFEKNKEDILLHIEFYNGYPYCNELFYMPTPLHLRTDKHKWREAKVKGEPSYSLSNLFENSINKNYLDYSFVAIEEDKLFGINIDREYRLHHFMYHKIEEGIEEEENIFRYQSIVADNTFKAIIKYDKKLDEIMNLVFKEELTLYLGGSKGSGYGKCKVTGKNTLEDFESVKHKLGIKNDKINKKNEIMITCLSDCLFRNEFGQPISHISEIELTQIIGKNVTLEKQIIKTEETQGFNTTWKARYPKETTVKAGSILKYKFQEDLTEEEMNEVINKLEKAPFGIRTQDGYGWLGLNLYYPKEIYFQQNNETKQKEVLFSNRFLNKEEKERIRDNESFKVIALGLKEAKKRWLRSIYRTIIINGNSEQKKQTTDVSNDKLIISDTLKGTQKRNMQSVIQETDRKKISEVLLDREYMNNNTLFSLNGINLKEIYEYLNGKEKKDVIKVLKNFIKDRLDTFQGQLFFFNDNTQSNEKEIEKRFILEFLNEVFYMERIKEGEDE